MAMQSVLESTTLRMTDNYGVVDGKTVTKQHSYSKIRATAGDSEIYALARAIDSLTEPTTDAVYAVRVTALTESV
ncbi:MAG: DUF1659 domain-containing protein [Eubacteriaceae bacterium]|nr:DUF1659 domain-containing protein [Eubacteriaceae bacterium]